MIRPQNEPMQAPTMNANMPTPQINPLMEYLFFSTDFWAEYTLAKK
jgi:hypothetical protein